MQVPIPPSYSIILIPHSLDLWSAEFFEDRTQPLPPRHKEQENLVSRATLQACRAYIRRKTPASVFSYSPTNLSFTLFTFLYQFYFISSMWIQRNRCLATLDGSWYLGWTPQHSLPSPGLSPFRILFFLCLWPVPVIGCVLGFFLFLPLFYFLAFGYGRPLPQGFHGWFLVNCGTMVWSMETTNLFGGKSLFALPL